MAFTKGHKPWNKGIHVENAGTFKKGHAPTSFPKGGTIVCGYRYITVSKGKRMYEHRYVMEQYLGRKLEKNEQVHHINYDKLDNRIDNLQLIDPVTHGRESANKRWRNLTKIGGYCGVC